MREDMAKVIVERPRIGSRLRSRKKGYRKHVQQTGVEELPRREPMLGRWRGRERWLNEHLGPMRRFLRSNVGRPWNKVHQDLCEHVSFDNAVQMHVLTHVFDYVERLVRVDGNRIIPTAGFRHDRPLPAGHMYVCPNTGLLRVVRKPKQRSQPKRHIIDATLQYRFRDNVWWEVRVDKLPSDPGELWDVWLERDVARLTETDCIAEYGGKLFACSKRPLTPREARDLRRELRKRKRLGTSRR
jgi:hypothetical protein